MSPARPNLSELYSRAPLLELVWWLAPCALLNPNFHIFLESLTWPCLFVLQVLVPLLPASFPQPHFLFSPAVFPGLGFFPSLMSHISTLIQPLSLQAQEVRLPGAQHAGSSQSLPSHPAHSSCAGCWAPGLTSWLRVSHSYSQKSGLSGFLLGIGLRRAVKQHSHFSTNWYFLIHIFPLLREKPNNQTNTCCSIISNCVLQGERCFITLPVLLRTVRSDKLTGNHR